MESKKTFKRHLRRDAVIFVFSIIAAVAITKSGLLSQVFLPSVESEVLGALIAGVLFTSLFTTPIAIAMFLSLAVQMNLLVLIAAGALGAIIGDLLLFTFIRHTFADDVDYLLSRKLRHHRIIAALNRRMFRWAMPFVGAIVIAIPFMPDELGIGIMGVSRMSASTLVVISFVMNALSIAFVSLFA